MTETDKTRLLLIRTMLEVIVEAVADASPQGIPSSYIYLAMQTQGVSLDSYQAMIDHLALAGAINNINHLLTVNLTRAKELGFMKCESTDPRN